MNERECLFWVAGMLETAIKGRGLDAIEMKSILQEIYKVIKQRKGKSNGNKPRDKA